MPTNSEQKTDATNFNIVTPESNRIINNDPDFIISIQFTFSTADNLLCKLIAQKDTFDIFDAKDLSLVTSVFTQLELFNKSQYNSFWLPFLKQNLINNYSLSEYQEFLQYCLIKPEIVIDIYRYALNVQMKNAIILARLATKEGYDGEIKYISQMKIIINHFLSNLMSYIKDNKDNVNYDILPIIDKALLNLSKYVPIY